MRLRDYPMTRVIARRSLDYRPRKGPPGKVVVEVGKPARKPARDPTSPDWYCPYRIRGARKERIVPIFGGDSLQALILTLAALSMDVTRWNDREKALSWHGDRRWLGLQVHRVLNVEARQIARGLRRQRKSN